MLNRKASNYIFYGILLGIALVILLIRLTLLGTINARIVKVETSSRQQQDQIDLVDEIVQENKNKQEAHLYELYTQVPAYFSSQELKFKTFAMAQNAEIYDDDFFQREVTVVTNPTFNTNSIYYELQQDFDIAEVTVTFNIDQSTETSLELMLRNIVDSEQIFIISDVNYQTPTGELYQEVSIQFLAFYEKGSEENAN